MNFVKSTVFASTLLLSLASNAASLSTIGTQDNGVFNEMQQIQLKSAGERSSAKSADIFFINSNDVQVEDLNKKLLQDFNSIVIIGDALKNKELMVKLVGFGIEREAVVLMDTVTRNQQCNVTGDGDSYYLCESHIKTFQLI